MTAACCEGGMTTAFRQMAYGLGTWVKEQLGFVYRRLLLVNATSSQVVPLHWPCHDVTGVVEGAHKGCN